MIVFILVDKDKLGDLLSVLKYPCCITSVINVSKGIVRVTSKANFRTSAGMS